MKKILGLFMLAGIAGTAYGQDKTPEAGASRWYFGISGKYLHVAESIKFLGNGQNYLNTIEAEEPSTSLQNEAGWGCDLQIGYFFDKKAQWGIATGLMYERYKGVLSLDKLRLQYQSTDFQGDVFRQVVTAERPFTESLRTTIVSIPVVLKYRRSLSDRLGLMIDAGAVINIRAHVRSISDARFRYEAIYKYVGDGAGYTSVYDADITPDPNDWLITEAHYQATSGDGQEAQYFEDLRQQGYNVALGQDIREKHTVFYRTGSVGALLQPSLTYAVSKNVGLQLGGFLMYQRYGGTKDVLSKKIADKAGSYNSYLNNAESSRQMSYGVNAGLNLFW